MDFGSLADWVGAIGGFLAAFAAVVAWRVNRRMLTVEQQRDEQQEARQRYENYIEKREQAGLVFSLGLNCPSVIMMKAGRYTSLTVPQNRSTTSVSKVDAWMTRERTIR
ncbi:hypothetical protein GCM10009720_10750 [Yaniella flava]|uniref:Uncharacterized protein n=1 Tax=Yaniella flava TaxID=287930 RepID=A0ABN2UAX4_9MICC